MSPIITVNKLFKTYKDSGKNISAVQDISFEIGEGECLGLVGESGSGKSTIGRILLALEQPDAGEVLFQGESLLHLRGRALREQRKYIQVVFQDPTAALNQRLPIWRSIMEPLDNFPNVEPPFLADVRHSRRDTTAKLLDMVGLPAELMDRYPHQMSGGQRQRVAIARGISLMPKLLICDEPTSSLDVSIQAQILQLLKKLKTELGMAYLFISHDITAVLAMSERIMVMKDGQMVDHFDSLDILSPNRHPYTKKLVDIVS